ncbi:hypothetical protein AB9K23_05805, partial [Tenacibaculum singaporense]
STSTFSTFFCLFLPPSFNPLQPNTLCPKVFFTFCSWVLGIGYWVLGIGYWVLGIGYWVKVLLFYSIKINYLKVTN